ncbi:MULTISPECIES: response regulator [unclassified Haematospirillum]|uniref:response regulator n=1 Tax=unclassified Haematospirillum TaxID=2622088 RepID=UPI00143B0BAA|nr:MULTISPECIES: response regulator [unclassified Haematospirillum]NKD55047.1 response regulator [Haematospirillum sp. H4890]NKD76057.1 response regulator [Haematospirillum sp. H4485]NKD88649.1 response regulator [Haematospirillum sp. 15-248]
MVSRVLFVDDEQNVLSALRRTFHGEFELETAGNAVEAMRLFLDGERFAVMVTDMDMPAINGLQLLEQVRKHSPRTCRIVLTGKPNADAATELLSDGLVFRYLLKPCTPAKLRDIIREGIVSYEQANLRSNNARHFDTPATESRHARQTQVYRLRNGDEVAASVLDRDGRVLVSSGTVLDQDLLSKLRKLLEEGRIGENLTIYSTH